MIELGLINYWMVVFLLVTGLYVLMARQNLVKKVLGLSIFQSAVIIFFVALGKVRGGTAPIYTAEDLQRIAGGSSPEAAYSNPVPHVLMLTAIVVGIATVALALALVARIHEAYGSIEERDIIGRGEAS
jgi:multicomponent Na+:H+ antiporter subunit C